MVIVIKNISFSLRLLLEQNRGNSMENKSVLMQYATILVGGKISAELSNYKEKW